MSLKSIYKYTHALFFEDSQDVLCPMSIKWAWFYWNEKTGLPTSTQDGVTRIEFTHQPERTENKNRQYIETLFLQTWVSASTGQ